MRSILLVVMSVAFAASLTARQADDALAKRIRSDDWHIRSNALDEIVRDENWINSDEAIQLIVELQDQENHRLAAILNEGRDAERVWGTAYWEYYLWQLGPATQRILQERPSESAIAVFARHAYSPGTVYADLLARTGHLAAPAFTQLAADADPYMRAKAASVLQIMMEHEAKGSVRLPEATRKAVTAALVRLTDDDSWGTRRDAALGLGYSDDPAAIAVLERLAAYDPWAPPDGTWPVRRAASEALARLKARLRR